jgi:tetratricopeptide (TPR) repeat protein
MGNLGKSSLAGRVANRLSTLETVVIYRHYDPLTVLEQVGAALPPDIREATLKPWRTAIGGDGSVRIEPRPEALAEALEALLVGPFFERPILLVVDDLEQVLEPPAPGQALTPVAAENGWRSAIAAILAAFRNHRGGSRLILTSRFDFEARDGSGRDLAADLVRVPLTPFDAGQRNKQWRAGLEARQRAGGADMAALADPRLTDLLARALDVAAGNPGLQDLLTRPLMAGEFDAVGRAIAAVSDFAARRALPGEDNAAFDFFRRMTFEVYRAALAPAEVALLRAASVFGEGAWPDDVDAAPLRAVDLGVVPIPAAAIEAVGLAAGVGDPAAARVRLAGLGLLDVYVAASSDAASDGYAVNCFGRPLVEMLDVEERRDLAAAALPALAAAWKAGDWPFDPRALETARLAMLADAVEEVEPAALAAFGHLFMHYSGARHTRAALSLGEGALARAGTAPNLVLVRRLAEAAGRLGEAERRAAILKRGLTAKGGDLLERAQLDVEEAHRLNEMGDPKAAMALLQAAALQLEGLDDQNSLAVARGRIADLLEDRGDYDGALRIHRDEELPVYQKLGKVFASAVTIRKIADLDKLRGRLPTALAGYHRALELLQSPGSLHEHEIATCLGGIAQVMQACGEFDAALGIHRDEQLPIYERMGDVRERTITMGHIANVHEARGDLEEALLIRTDVELPVYEQLGLVRERSITLQKIARVLIEQNGLTDHRSDKILSALEEAYQIAHDLDNPEGIACVGYDFAGVLACMGLCRRALEVLDVARSAFVQLGNAAGVRDCDDRRRDVERGGA